VRVAPAPRAKRLVGKIRAEDGQHEDAIDELLPDVEAAFTGPSFWAPFLKRAHTAGIPRPERLAGHHRADCRGPPSSCP